MIQESPQSTKPVLAQIAVYYSGSSEGSRAGKGEGDPGMFLALQQSQSD